MDIGRNKEESTNKGPEIALNTRLKLEKKFLRR